MWSVVWATLFFLIWVKGAEPVGHALSGESVYLFVVCFGEGIELAYKALLSMMVVSEGDLEGYKIFSVMRWHGCWWRSGEKVMEPKGVIIVFHFRVYLICMDCSASPFPHVVDKCQYSGNEAGGPNVC